MVATVDQAAPEPTAPDRPVIELFKHRPYWRWAAAVTLLRMSPLMLPLALVLISIHYTGSPAVGGLLVGVSMAPTIIGAPLAGRILDRLGPATWVVRLMIFGVAMRAAVAIGFVIRLPVVALVVLTLVGAVATCGIGGAARALLQEAVPTRLVGTALSLDSVSAEFVVISAPFIVVVTAIPGAVWPMIATSVLGVFAALLLRSRLDSASTPTQTPSRPPLPAGTAKWRLLGNREFLFWVLVTLAFGQMMGTADLSVLPLAVDHHGGTPQAAVLAAVLGVASAAMGFGYAWFGKRLKLSLITQSLTLLVLMTGSVLLISSVGGWIPLVLAFAFLGLWSAPLNTVMSEAPGLLVPRERMAEAFNILASAGVLGFASAGLLLAILPFKVMFVLGPTLAVVALAAAPFLLGRRLNATAQPAPDEPDEPPVEEPASTGGAV